MRTTNSTRKGIFPAYKPTTTPPQTNIKTSHSILEELTEGCIVKLTKEEINDAIATTRARMVALNINPNLLAPQVIPNRIDAPGNVKAGPSSCDRYHAAMLSFRNFCYRYGDYDSAMMLNHTCIPRHCWTVNLNTTRIFLRYQCMENGLDLKHPDTNAPVPWPNHPTGQ